VALESVETSPQLSHYETGYLKVNANLNNMTRYNNRQSGVALMVGLIILLLLSIIVVTAMRVSSLEERMAGNLRNQNTAFQAAESALREAEAFIESGAASFAPLKLSGAPFRNTTTPFCVSGLCSDSGPVQSEVFPYIDGAMRTAGTHIATITAEPEYIIELIRIDPSTDSSRVYATFRITTQAWGGDTSGHVQLQSTYRLHAISFIH